MSRILLQFGLIGGLVGVVTVVNAVDKNVNYTPVSAEVLGVEESCFLEKEEGNKRRFTDPMECPMAEALLAAHPAYKGFDLVHDRTLELWYPDPVTQQYMKTKLELGNSKAPEVKPGDEIDVLAHKKKSGKVRKS